VALFAADELAGFVMAVARVRPNRSLAEVDVRAVRKKMKDKAFAAAVSRDDIARGAAELNVPLDEHIAFVVEALQGNAEALGLAGDR
jgi:predicted hydrolase (HD superfamily)